eukprot:1399238-Rhodomonas_salina.2
MSLPLRSSAVRDARAPGEEAEGSKREEEEDGSGGSREAGRRRATRRVAASKGAAVLWRLRSWRWDSSASAGASTERPR